MEQMVLELEKLYCEITNKEYKFNLNSNFINDLGMTSVTFIYYMLKLEEKYDLKLDEVSYHQLETVIDLVNYINNKKEN